MIITHDMLIVKGACFEASNRFREVFGESGDYQAVLDQCAADDRLDWAKWLLKEVGPDRTAVKEITEQPKTRHLFASGRLETKVANQERFAHAMVVLQDFQARAGP